MSFSPPAFIRIAGIVRDSVGVLASTTILFDIILNNKFVETHAADAAR